MKLRKRRESERIKKAAAFKLNEKAAISKERLKHKKQKLSGSLELKQLLRKYLQGINKPSVKPHGQRTLSKQQIMHGMGRSDQDLDAKQENTNIIQSFSSRKKKMDKVKNALPKKKCRITEAQYQCEDFNNLLSKCKRPDSVMPQKHKLFETRILQENLNTKQKTANPVKTSVKRKKKIDVSKLKHRLPEALNQSNKLVKSCLNNVNEMGTHKSEKKQKSRLSNKQKSFAKTDAHLVPCRKLKNQQKNRNKRQSRKSMKLPSLIKSGSKTNTLGKNKKGAPTHETVCQLNTILPGIQKAEHLKGQNLKPVKTKWEKASENEGSEDEELDNLPLIHLLQNHTTSWPNSKIHKSKKFTLSKKQKLSGLEEIVPEKKKMPTGQKSVKKQQKGEVKDSYFAVEQNIKDLKAENSRLLKQIDSWERRGKALCSKKRYKEKALIKHHIIPGNSCSTQTDVQTIEVESQTEIVLGFDEIISKEKYALQEDTTVDVKSITIQDGPASLNDIIDNQGINATVDSDSKDFNEKMSLIDVEENITEYSGLLNENKGANNSKNADHGSPQNFHRSEAKDCAISQNLEPLWNPQSSRAECQGDMKDSNLVCSEEEPIIIEIHDDEPESVSQPTTTRQGGLHPSEVVTVKLQRDDIVLQPSSNCNSRAMHQQDTEVPSFSSSSAVQHAQAAVPQAEGWVHRSATCANGFRITQLVRPSYISSITSTTFPLNIQQDLVNLTESIREQPVQQISPNVFIYDPLVRSQQH